MTPPAPCTGSPMNAATINRWFGRGWLGAGFVFLYLPIVALVLYSFNDSPIQPQVVAAAPVGQSLLAPVFA